MLHPTAIISEGATLGKNVSIGPFTIVHDNVVIGNNTIVESHCELGCGSAEEGALVIGKNSLIRSHSIFYRGSSFGDQLITGHRVTVRERTRAGQNFQIGTLCDIQGDNKIGDYVRFHSNVFISKHSKIENYVWIFPYVVLTNDPHPPSDIVMGVLVEEYAAIATMSVVLPGVTIAKGALVGAASCVTKDVEKDTIVAGSPAKLICQTNKLKLKDGSDKPAYPWRRHFHRGYPEDVITQWLEEFS